MIFPPIARLLAALTAILVLAAPARAQDGAVDVTITQFGLQQTYRPGGIVGMWVKLTALPDSALEEATSVWVQWEVANVDGDIGEYGRPVTLTKRRPVNVWLAAPVSPNTNVRPVWSVRVFEYDDGQRGREIGGTRYEPPRLPNVGLPVITSAMIATVGRSQMGLGQLRLSGAGSLVTISAHEDTIGVFGLRPTDMPDRWEGLLGLEALAWSGAEPQDLSTAQSDAIREWVRRGGHLIISLPEDTNPWGVGEVGTTDLEDLLPTKSPRKDDEVHLSTLMPILSKSRGLGPTANDFTVGIRVFADLGDGADRGFDALSNGYEPLIALPDGRVVVVQRIFGHGRVTVIGIDLANAQLVNTHPIRNGNIVGLPQADVFWARILGRRADTPTAAELTQIKDRERLSAASPNETTVGGPKLVDINMSGRAGAGLLMAVVLFIAYWLVAGPGGFYVLKQMKQQQHAWLFFAAAAGVFTAAAWGGVNLLRQNDISIRHNTVLDHIVPVPGYVDTFGTNPQLQRSVAWLSVFLPGYGSVPIGIDSDEASEGVPQQRDLLIPWEPPGVGSQTFPNTDRYRVDLSRQPDDYEVPARATSTQFYAHHLGGLRREWGSMIREDPDDPIRLEIDGRGNETLRGSIINELPGRLEDVTVIWVWNQRVSPARYAIENDAERFWTQRSGQMLNVGRMWRVGAIEEGAGYAIPEVGADASLGNNIFTAYVREFESSSYLPSPTNTVDKGRRRQFHEMLSFYHQLSPPKYIKQPKTQNPNTMMAKRMMGRELDLSPWFTRPCVIVLGYLESPCPIPVRVDGEAVPSEGTTMVRWIRPLPVETSIAFEVSK